VQIDLNTEPLGVVNGQPIYLRDIWPTDDEIRAHLVHAQDPDAFRRIYDTLVTGNETWNAIPSTDEQVYNWNEASSYIQEPPFFVGMSPDKRKITPIEKARALVMVGDSMTTDHISPAGSIPAKSPAGKFLISRGVAPADFNSYGSRRGNDRVMTRGTFANIRIHNLLAPGTEGGWTTCFLTGEVTSIYEASLKYIAAGVPTIVIGGRDYGMGSSRDWAAKGAALLGVKAVLAKSFETIHRINLIGMGILTLQFLEGEGPETLGLTGREVFKIRIDDRVKPGQQIEVRATAENGKHKMFRVICRLDTPIEVEYYRHGGIMPMVLRQIIAQERDQK
jgi:aconitate hydratase